MLNTFRSTILSFILITVSILFFACKDGDDPGDPNGGDNNSTAGASYTITLQVSPPGAGTAVVSPVKSSYALNEQVTLIATANAGYTFSGWGGDFSSGAQIASMTVTGNMNITAAFGSSSSSSSSASSSSSSSSTSSSVSSPGGGSVMIEDFDGSVAHITENVGTGNTGGTITGSQTSTAYSGSAYQIDYTYEVAWKGNEVQVPIPASVNAFALGTEGLSIMMRLANVENYRVYIRTPNDSVVFQSPAGGDGTFDMGANNTTWGEIQLPWTDWSTAPWSGAHAYANPAEAIAAGEDLRITILIMNNSGVTAPYAAELSTLHTGYIDEISMYGYGGSSSSSSSSTSTSSGSTSSGGNPYNKSNPQLVYVHYMPWFTSTATGGHWDSHYTPLIGRYNNIQDKVLKYHALLIKAAGMDGIIFDWYGTTTKWDYDDIHARTVAMKAVCEDVGLKYAICYEDRTVQDNGWAAQAQSDFVYLKDNWFNQSSYLEVGGQDIVLNFGPIQIFNNTDWINILNSGGNPKLFQLEGQSRDAADGEFAWVSECETSGGLNTWYNVLTGGDYCVIGAALPRYRDVYGAHADINAGGDPQYITDLLARATTHNPAVVQIITFNDYGEGTMVEPTVEDQYAFLQRIQTFTGVGCNLFSMQTIKKFYDHYNAAGSFNGNVSATYNLLKAGDFSGADALMDTY